MTALKFDLPIKINGPASWRINLPCMPFVANFSLAATNFTACALNASLPPIICTECFEQYMDMKYQYDAAQHADKVFSLLNTTCTEVMFQDYLSSYVKEVFDSLEQKLWVNSKCDYCLRTDFRTRKVEFTNITYTFMRYLWDWRECIQNVSESGLMENKTTCVACVKPYETLYSYYWDNYVNPEADFCLDVKSTMNDTTNLWRSIFKCADPRPNRQSESISVIILSAIFVTITALFYAGSFIQGERKKRDLIKYSRLRTPQGPRSRLLSASLVADEDDDRFLEVPATSSQMPSR
uniref:Osteopetrosis-associated transmembrane protein 1 n=1 Tax=Plectus sambesii TaxID=2011161 RepID=A0A914UV31_9BILA